MVKTKEMDRKKYTIMYIIIDSCLVTAEDHIQ